MCPTPNLTNAAQAGKKSLLKCKKTLFWEEDLRLVHHTYRIDSTFHEGVQ